MSTKFDETTTEPMTKSTTSKQLITEMADVQPITDSDNSKPTKYTDTKAEILTKQPTEKSVHLNGLLAQETVEKEVEVISNATSELAMKDNSTTTALTNDPPVSTERTESVTGRSSSVFYNGSH